MPKAKSKSISRRTYTGETKQLSLRMRGSLFYRVKRCAEDHSLSVSEAIEQLVEVGLGIRKKLKRTQKEFAAMIGVSVATLRNWAP